MADSTRSELRAGLAETRRYLLSHHTPEGYHRCYAVRVRGRRVRLCARCLGVYPGIAIGAGLFAVGAVEGSRLALVAVLPMPALVDWTVTHLGRPDGRNTVRTATGLLLGTGYGLGLGHLLLGREPLVLAVGLVYAVLTALALLTHRGLFRS